MADASPELRHLTHLLVTERARDEGFHRGGQGNVKVRPVERRAHGIALRNDLDSAFSTSDADRQQVSFTVDELQALGTFVTLEGGDAKYPLDIDRLLQYSSHRNQEPLPKWLLMSVHPATEDRPERAVVWVSDTYRAAFIKLFQDYLDKTSTRGNPEHWDTPEGNPANRALVANIARIRQAILEDLWQSEGLPPQFGSHWWELWLDRTDTTVRLMRTFGQDRGIRVRDQVIELNNRIVMWVEAPWSTLTQLPFTSVPIAEIRRPEFIDTIEDLSVDEQSEYVRDLADRVSAAAPEAPAVCHLDSGVLRGHELLSASLAVSDVHDALGGAGDDGPSGHGTAMAGLGLYGVLDELLTSTGDIALSHRLESVRILPKPGEPDTDRLDYGTITAVAVALPEATVQRSRVFCMPVSTAADRSGEPTLWSATVDALAAGVDVVREDEQLRLLSAPNPIAARLIVVSAGNVDFDADIARRDYLADADLQVVDDPAQAWNVLVVGAHTDLVTPPSHPDYDGWRLIAQKGQLSPHSRTSVLFGSRWPIRPDICLEGGNVLVDGQHMYEDRLPTLALRTTGTSNDLALTTANATSAATAQAARLAAIAMSEYPQYWPETIRGLLVHAAEWTPAMRAELDAAKDKKTQQVNLLRRYGWGVPTEDAVLRSSRQSVTLVTQDEFVPFEGTDYKMRRFRLHSLPWPTEVLKDLGANPVSLRVTLSYFVEPSPAKRGWRQRYTYASHSLRFELQDPAENQRQFISRINKDESGSSGSRRWRVGPNQRNTGSLHQDIWDGTGDELARCDTIAVYPVGGWWKRNSRKDRLDLPVRYALLISLRTPEQDIDLYTPISAQITAPIAAEIII